MEKYSVPDVSTLTLAYIAGLVDGEGTISIRRMARRKLVRGRLVEEYGPVLSVAQKDRMILDWLRETFLCGGITRVSTAHGMLSADGSTASYWHVQYRQAVEIVRAIQPYLRIKRRQADLVLSLDALKAEYLRTRRAPGVHGTKATPPELLEQYRDLCEQIQRLNGRKIVNVGPRDAAIVERGKPDLICTECSATYKAHRYVSEKGAGTGSHYCPTCRANGAAARAATAAYRARRKAVQTE